MGSNSAAWTARRERQVRVHSAAGPSRTSSRNATVCMAIGFCMASILPYFCLTPLILSSPRRLRSAGREMGLFANMAKYVGAFAICSLTMPQINLMLENARVEK